MTSDQQHRPHRYLVDCHDGRVDVHCPACLSRSDGWYTDGQPKYSSGTLTLRSPAGEEATWACPCWVGQDRAARSRWLIGLDISTPLPGWTNPLPFGAVLWDRDLQRSCPVLPEVGEAVAPGLGDILGSALQGLYWPSKPSRLAARMAED